MQQVAQPDSFGAAGANRDLRGEVTALRRRLWIERAVFTLLLAGFLGVQVVPALFPRVWAVYLRDEPLVSMRERGALESVLTQVRAARHPAPVNALLTDLRLGSVDPGRVPPTDATAAARALTRAVGERAERGVIYVDGTPVVALPEIAEADAVLARLREQATRGLKKVETPPDFKEPIEVRAEPAPADLWGDRETALGLLAGAGSDDEGTHTVRTGESAWLIARRTRTSVDQLKALNPGTNLARLQVGQKLKVGRAAAPLVTLVTSGVMTETIPAPYGTLTQRHPKLYVGKTVVKRAGRPGLQRVTYRVTRENGKVVRREVVSRERIRAPRDAVIALGALPRPR